MTALKVIGVDLSLTATGIASSLGWCQTIGEEGITTRPLDERLDAIDRLARDILIVIGGGRGSWPALVAIEIPAFSRSGAGSHERSALWWTVVRSLRRREVPVAEVGIQQRMRYATGKGSASKGAVIDAVARRLPMFETNGDDNCADAAILAAMAADHLGQPMTQMPQTHRAALDAVQWPDLAPLPTVGPGSPPVPGELDEHGNLPDSCGHCTLIPGVSRWVRGTQVGCPVHDPNASRPVVVPHSAWVDDDIEDIPLPGFEVAL